MATLSVTANSRNSRPMTPPMKSRGISTAMSETVSETIVKPICLLPFERRLEWAVALLDVAGDVLDHHDRVVDDEPGRDGEGHERQVVEAIPEEVHDSERADERKRNGDARDRGRPQVAQEHQHHRDDETNRQEQRELTSSTDARTVSVLSDMTLTLMPWGIEAWSWGSSAFTRSATWMMFAPGCRWMLRMMARSSLGPTGKLGVLDSVDHIGDLGEAKRRAISVSDDQRSNVSDLNS